jgi:predicted DNA-binding transcriptional regulator AlpA
MNIFDYPLPQFSWRAVLHLVATFRRLLTELGHTERPSSKWFSRKPVNWPWAEIRQRRPACNTGPSVFDIEKEVPIPPPEALQLPGVSRTTFCRLRHHDSFPRPVQVFGNSNTRRWKYSEVNHWRKMQERQFAPPCMRIGKTRTVFQDGPTSTHPVFRAIRWLLKALGMRK